MTYWYLAWYFRNIRKNIPYILLHAFMKILTLTGKQDKYFRLKTLHSWSCLHKAFGLLLCRYSETTKRQTKTSQTDITFSRKIAVRSSVAFNPAINLYPPKKLLQPMEIQKSFQCAIRHRLLSPVIDKHFGFVENVRKIVIYFPHSNRTN